MCKSFNVYTIQCVWICGIRVYAFANPPMRNPMCMSLRAHQFMCPTHSTNGAWRHWCNNLLRQVCPPWRDVCRYASLRQVTTCHMPHTGQTAPHATYYIPHATCHIPNHPLKHTSKAHTPQVLLYTRSCHHTVHSYTPTWTTLPSHISLNYCTDTYWEQGEKWRRSSGTRNIKNRNPEQGRRYLSKSCWNWHL